MKAICPSLLYRNDSDLKTICPRLGGSTSLCSLWFGLFLWFFGYGVKSAGVERVAFQNSLHRQPSPFDGTKPRHRFYPVVRASRVKATCRGLERGKKSLVKADEHNQQLGHHHHSFPSFSLFLQ
ncbi:hypothetical protein GTNG_2763 [Geobacillus thermodenitrificans NG80-2]|uniref:Uncharacterized protein n=1 Tax=Geobacillus thermodenitrificans (strain NG80-2) TaxID=420246 RepID=A4IS04_GEOTN|nr:hypothetical protein GTNG_2763 [Geobacillus thermodenitrificans NG80-2]